MESLLYISWIWNVLYLDWFWLVAGLQKWSCTLGIQVPRPERNVKETFQECNGWDKGQWLQEAMTTSQWRVVLKLRPTMSALDPYYVVKDEVEDLVSSWPHVSRPDHFVLYNHSMQIIYNGILNVLSLDCAIDKDISKLVTNILILILFNIDNLSN